MKSPKQAQRGDVVSDRTYNFRTIFTDIYYNLNLQVLTLPILVFILDYHIDTNFVKTTDYIDTHSVHPSIKCSKCDLVNGKLSKSF